jgi:hypothetical protein
MGYSSISGCRLEAHFRLIAGYVNALKTIAHNSRAACRYLSASDNDNWQDLMHDRIWQILPKYAEKQSFFATSVAFNGFGYAYKTRRIFPGKTQGKAPMKTRISKLKNRYPLHIQITVLFTLLIVSIGSIIILFSHSRLTKLAEISTHQRYQQTGKAIAAELNSLTRTMAGSVNILAKMAVADAATEPQRMAQLSSFIMVLQQNDYASSVYCAWDNGDFFILRRLTNQNRRYLKAPPMRNGWCKTIDWMSIRRRKKHLI